LDAKFIFISADEFYLDPKGSVSFTLKFVEVKFDVILRLKIGLAKAYSASLLTWVEVECSIFTVASLIKISKKKNRLLVQ